MTDKELHKLNRKELLELMLDQSRQLDDLREQLRQAPFWLMAYGGKSRVTVRCDAVGYRPNSSICRMHSAPLAAV